MAKYSELSGLNTSAAATLSPISSKIPGSDQVKNLSGGYVFQVSEWDSFRRFLILGTSTNSYYASAQSMTKEATETCLNLIKKDSNRVVDTIVDVSDRGLALKNDAAIFALALTVANTKDAARLYALSALTKVCRTSTHLFSFVGTYKSIGGGFGSSVRKAINSWYQSKTPDQLAYQMIKYRQRDGWTHHDVLHLSHPKPVSEEQNSCFKFAKGVELNERYTPAFIEGYKLASSASSEKEIVSLIGKYSLPREALPTEYQNSPKVWEALLPEMGSTALLRNLGNLSKSGLLGFTSNSEKMVLSKLSDSAWLKKGRIHPLSVLIAAKVYGAGRGVKGSGTWNVNQRIADALQEAFYNSFDNIEPTNETYMMGVDVSGSMTWDGSLNGVPFMKAAEAAITLAMVLNKQNPNSMIMGFSNHFVDLKISYKDRLETACNRVYNRGMGFGSTDCSLPMRYALENKLNIDKFIVITDNETNSGKHPSQELSKYRNSMGRSAAMIVCATQASKFSIADPKDPRQIDIIGFSADIPQVIAAV